MLFKYFKICLPHLNLLTKVVLAIGILIMVGIGALAIRMQQGPMDLDFAKHYVEEALSDASRGYKVEIGSLGLAWPEVTSPLLLDLSAVKIIQQGTTALSVDHVALDISELNLLRGKILPTAVVINRPTFQLVQQDGSFNFFWQEENTQSENASENKTVQTPREIRASMRKFLEQMVESDVDLGIFSTLERFELSQAVLTAQKVNEDKTGYLALVDISMQKSKLGLQGNLQVFLPGEEGQTAEIKSDVIYRKEQKDLTFSANVNDVNPARFTSFFPNSNLMVEQDMRVTGAVRAAFGPKLKLQLANVNLNIPQGSIVVPDIYEEPVALKDIILEADFNRPDKKLEIKKFNADFGGIVIEASADGAFDDEMLTAPINLKISELPLEKIKPIFPKSEIESSIGEWMTKRFQKGRFYDIELTSDLKFQRLFNRPVNKTLKKQENETSLEGEPEPEPERIRLDNTKLSFKTEGVTVKYHDTLTPVTNVKADGVYENDTLTVNGHSGDIKDIKGTNVKLVMTGLSVEGGGFANLSLDASGPLKSALEYVSDEPISLGQKLGFDLNQVKGNLDYNVQLSFPTLKDLPAEEVKVIFKGVATNMVLPNVVKDMSLTGGPYNISFEGGAVTLKGSGQLAGQPIKLDYLEYLEPKGRPFQSKIIAKVDTNPDLRARLGVGLEDYIDGSLPVEVTYLDKGVKATIDIKGDLTPTTLQIEPFKYSKPSGASGEITLKAYMNNEDIQEVDQLKLTAPGLSFSNGRLLFKKLKNGDSDISLGSIPKIKLGQTDIKADFEVTPNDVLKIVASGPIFDIRPFIKSDKNESQSEIQNKSDEQLTKISLIVDKMIGSDDVTLRSGKLYLETDREGEVTRMELDSKIGSGDMYLRFKPEEGTGKRTFRLESSDAGETLKAFGLYDKIRGGSMIIYGQPLDGDDLGNLYGTAQIENFRVKSAPALAKLLNAMSLNGAQDLLKNDGLSFKKLKSDFEWRFRETGNLLVIKDGRTSGSSLGLTFEGVVNQEANNVDISGTVIPLSGVNKVIGDIPLIGTLLTGGDALIAATYAMKGATNDPKVTVNPLSVLAPGFLRKILFEGSVESKVKRDEKKSGEASNNNQSKTILPGITNNTEKNFNMSDER